MDRVRTFVSMVIIITIALVFSQANILFAGDFGIKVQGGYVNSIVDEAIDGFSETEWSGGTTYGANATYRFSSGLTLRN